MPQDGLYSKYFIFNATAPATLTEYDSYGFGDITLAMDGNDIVVTSADSEFVSTMQIDDNQQSASRYVSTGEIRITPRPYLDWGTLQAELIVYNE